MADEAYFKQHGLEAKLTELINEVAAAKPADPLRYLYKLHLLLISLWIQ